MQPTVLRLPPPPPPLSRGQVRAALVAQELRRGSAVNDAADNHCNATVRHLVRIA